MMLAPGPWETGWFRRSRHRTTIAATGTTKPAGCSKWLKVAGLPLKLPAIAPKLGDTPADTRWAGPDLGAHSSEVLAELGLGEAAQTTLRTDGIVA